MKRAALIVLALLAPAAASAQEQNLANLESSQNMVQVKTGLEYAFLTSAGYSRAFAFLDRQLVLHGEFTLPVAGLDLSDYKLRAGAMAPIVAGEHWKLVGGISPILRGSTSELSTMTGVGIDFEVSGGYYAPHWFVAGELGFDSELTTHITHSQYYRAIAHPDAKDGWYATPGGNLRLGLQTGASVDRFDLVLRVGFLRDITAEPPVLPFYGTLAVNTRW